jgi:hypothetical protein
MLMEKLLKEMKDEFKDKTDRDNWMNNIGGGGGGSSNDLFRF